MTWSYRQNDELVFPGTHIVLSYITISILKLNDIVTIFSPKPLVSSRTNRSASIAKSYPSGKWMATRLLMTSMRRDNISMELSFVSYCRSLNFCVMLQWKSPPYLYRLTYHINAKSSKLKVIAKIWSCLQDCYFPLTENIPAKMIYFKGIYIYSFYF